LSGLIFKWEEPDGMSGFFLCIFLWSLYLCAMKIFTFVFSIILLFACGEKEDKVVQLDDLIEGSKTNYEVKDSSVQKTSEIKLSYFVQRLCDSLKIEAKYIVIDSAFTFPERFHPIKQDKVKFTENSDVHSYKHWKWGDSTKATQSFFNWLDQFGDKKVSLLVGDQVKVMKSGFLLLLQDKSIVYLEFGRTFKPEYYLHKLTNCGFGKHWKYVLYQQPQKKTTWIDCGSDTTKCPLYPQEEEIQKKLKK
jgi:hypothetical protein